jgi:LmbE family N-acetylglucosaminyl deacetylase
MLGKPEKDVRILILSPHLDDAVLSAGGLIDRTVKQGGSVVAGTIFTADAKTDGEASPLVRELHEWWGLGPKPYEIRREEDIASVRSLGADYIHGGLPDSIYRHGDGGEALYATRKAIFSSPSERDSIDRPLGDLISSWVKAVRPNVVLCPMAVGRHVDHVVTTEAARLQFSNWDAEVFLYEDIPYSAGFFPPDYPDSVPAARERSNWQITGHIDVEVDFEAKLAAIMKYRSQIAEIFPGRDAEQELRNYMRRDAAGLSERYWKVQQKDTSVMPADVTATSTRK